ncbi:MAG: anthranilate synthase component I family protein [Propionibacteriaceae bacterium]|nr:anthranilate synthase component I family protein [Propionibacteriaceae bacterium]
MDISPSLAQASEQAPGFARVPVYLTLPESVRDPLAAFLTLKSLSHHAYILESLEGRDKRGRYTFLGYDPSMEISALDGQLSIKGAASFTIETSDPGSYIAQIVAENHAPRNPSLPPFTGGLVGYFGFDYIKYAEPTLKLDAPDEEGFRDLDLMVFERVIAYDHVEGLIYLVVSIRTDNLEANYRRAQVELNALAEVLRSGAQAAPEPLRLTSDFVPLFNQDRFVAMVAKAKEHIIEGDIFQVVLSNRLAATCEGNLFDTYVRLRDINPSPYMFYFSSDDMEMAGASPETLVRASDGEVFTFPLAGTRPRGKTDAEDQLLEAELLADEKELAEHNMLVDLGRNDIGKIAEFGTVRVERYLNVERYSHVMHIGSTVRGTLRPDVSPLEVIAAVLPAGTLSGAPKIMACQIINDLEQCKRGIYGGALGYVSFSGDTDVCIAIRLAYKKNGRVFVRSGAGIVADSQPVSEYAECNNKAAAVVAALRGE